MLEVQNLRFAYGDRSVLNGVSLQVQAAESAFLLGPSGCGKSTLLRCIAGLESPSGNVVIDGRSVQAVPTHRRGVGMLFQEPALFPHLNVLHNVAFGLRYRGLPRAQRAKEAAHWLALVGLEDRGRDSVNQLSGGQKQRVALARTLAAKPRVVLLDEPFSALDRPLRNVLGPRVKQLLAEQRVPALWVTHDEQEAATWGDRVWRMKGGQLF